MASFTEEEINEFKVEAEELLDNAENGLLALDKGEVFTNHYDAIFRAFHSIKGAAGMMGMTQLQGHMHNLENTLTSKKKETTLAKQFIELFLKGADEARSLLSGKQVVTTSETTPVAPATPSKVLTEQKPVRVSKGKVLVVDDEPYIVEALTMILESADLETVGTTSPEEALTLIERFQPDAILSDVMMPKMTGLELLNKIRETHPDLPVIFVSGHVNKDSLIEAIGLGVYGVIEKPFENAKVIESCLSAVRHNRVFKLLNSSINLIMYQFYDLDEFLKSHGKEDVRGVIDRELKSLFEQRRKLRATKRA